MKRMIAIMIEQKILENVEYFNYLRSIMTIQNVHMKLKSRLSRQKRHSKSRIFGRFNFKEETTELLKLEHSFA
jgi:hypothetical protein